MRHRRFPSTPRHCVMQNGRRARCPHARHREQKLKPALRAALHSMLGKEVILYKVAFPDLWDRQRSPRSWTRHHHHLTLSSILYRGA